MSSIGERLREERTRLGLNQADFGALGSVQKQAQIKYERNERAPDAKYLAAIATHGVDVAYVLTGYRAQVQQALAHVRQAAELVSKLPSEGSTAKAALHGVIVEQLGSSSLTPREQALLDNYRNTPADRQRFIEEAAVMASQRDEAKGGSKR